MNIKLIIGLFFCLPAMLSAEPEWKVDKDLLLNINNNKGVSMTKSVYQEVCKKATEGNDSSYFLLGIVHFYGSQSLGISINREVGIDWLKKSVKKGNSAAEQVLGMIFLHGLGVAKNTVEAKRLLTLSALHGDLYACFYLGYMNMYGIGGERDIPEAKKAFTILVENEGKHKNIGPALLTLGLIYQHEFMKTHLAETAATARGYFEKTLKTKELRGTTHVPVAAIALGAIYEYGWGVNKNIEIANTFYEKGKTLDRTICFSLPSLEPVDTFIEAIIYQKGLGGPKDLIKAEQLFQKAKDLGFTGDVTIKRE